MSHIAIALQELLTENKMTGADLCRATGINMAQISRIRNGQQVWVNPEDLLRCAESLCNNQRHSLSQTHARLLCARLHDECAEPGAKLVTIKLASDPDLTAKDDQSQANKPVLAPRLQENLDLIASHITKKRIIRDMVEVLATQCREWQKPATSSE